MKLGDVKAEAIKLMNINFDAAVTCDNLDEFMQDETYASYLVNMDGSIQRGIDRIVSLGFGRIVTANAADVPNEFVRHEYGLTFVSVQGLSKFDALEDVTDSQHLPVWFNFDGSELCFETNHALISYRQNAQEVGSMKNTDEIDLDARIARLLPYYVKSELFEQDDPSAAAQARNMFEGALQDMENRAKSGGIKTVLKW